MKNTKIFITFICLFVLLCINTNVYAENSNLKRETRAVWITTVHNLDWPSNKSDIKNQKEEFIRILNEVEELGFNTVVVQVRPKGDAIYKSSINPWSDVLTGVQGKDPGYDPLEFMIEEAHNRNLEFHAWFNPYRITTSGTSLNVLSDENMAKKNPEWVISGKPDKQKDMYALFYNPGLPEVREYINASVIEVVNNYDIDGVHFDDYFYPESDFDDSDAYNRYGEGVSIEDFRRNSVNKLISDVSKSIKNVKSHVKFGVSPRGIWKNSSSDSTGSDTNGSQSYYDIYADTRNWIKNGYLDYVTPQLYWEINNKYADYSKLVSWWNREVADSKTHLFIGQGVHKVEVASQIKNQIEINRVNSNVKGSMYYRYGEIKTNNGGIKDSLKLLYKNKTLPYGMEWIDDKAPSKPSIKIERGNQNKITIKGDSDVSYYIIYKFKESESININDSSKIVGKIAKKGSETIYSDSSLDFDQNNIYVVTAVDRIHNESEYATEDKFNDIKGHWSEQYINEFVELGYINGYDDGTFRPNNPISRAEFVKLVNRAFNLTEMSDESFTDIGYEISSWICDEIKIGINSGYINTQNTEFRPYDSINREEACKIAGLIANITGDGKLSFYDNDEISYWAKLYVDGLNERGIVNGYDGYFKPNNIITRAEAVKILYLLAL